jgi:hypothetical protein
MVQLMSSSDFAAGGPQGNSLGGAGSGFSQLAQILAQAPMVRAKAGYYGAETEHARAQTEQLRQQMGVAQGRADRIREAQALMGNPAFLRDPNAMQRLYAIAMADPEIAAHINGIIGGVLASAALNGKATDAERDKTVAALGLQTFGGTQSGQTAALANTIAQQHVIGQETRLTADNQPVNAVPPGAPTGTVPTTMSAGDAKVRGWTIISPAEQAEQARPMSVVPGGAGYGTRAGPVPTGTVTAAPPGTYGAPEPSEVTDVNKPVTVLTPGGPRLRTEGSVIGSEQQPLLGGTDQTAGAQGQGIFWKPVDLSPGAGTSSSSAAPAPTPPANATTGQNDTSSPTSNTASASDGTSINLAQADTGDTDTDSGQPPAGSDLAALMSGVKLAQNTPAANVPGAVAAAGPAAGTPPAGGVPPSPAPPPAANAPPAAGTPGAPSTLADNFQAKLDQARQAGQIIQALKGGVPPAAPMNPTIDKQLDLDINDQAAKRYPAQPGGILHGNPSEWDPAAQNLIKMRALQHYTTLGDPARENTGLAVQAAISELEQNGRIPPPGYRSGGFSLPALVNQQRNVVGLQPAGTKFGEGGQPLPGQSQGLPARASPAGNQGPTNANAPQSGVAGNTALRVQVNPNTGQRWGLINNQWVPIDNSNQPIQTQASGQ